MLIDSVINHGLSPCSQNGFPEPYIRDSTVDENNLINGQLAAEYELREAPLDPATALGELQSQVKPRL